MKKHVIIVAGGKGLRMGGDIPKQFLPIGGKPVLMRTIEAFYSYDPSIHIILVLPLAQQAYWKHLCETYHFVLPHDIADGGETRFHSVKNGLALVGGEGLVGVHDGVRPFVSRQVIAGCYDTARQRHAVIPVIDVVETVRHLTGVGSETVPRNNYKLVQTPQVFDVQLLKGMTVRFDYYVSNTDNLLVDFDLSGSTGFNTFKENLGEVQNRGFDATINWRVYENTKNDAYVTLFGSVSSNKNEIKKISDALSKSNDEQIDDEGNPLSTKPYTRFEEGQSTSAIWAVRSLGIDPASGEEMFIDRNGYRTYVWNVNDQVVCGEANPKFQGNFGFNAEWRGLAVNCSFAYKAGGEYYNQTLVDRVENVDVQWNVDRRVFTGTWKEPGDRTFFKRVESTPTQTYPTSRFVEKSNELSLSSLNVSYDFKRLNVKRYVERLKIAFYMTDVFRVSTVKAERGLEYPFARTCSFSLQATF